MRKSAGWNDPSYHVTPEALVWLPITSHHTYYSILSSPIVSHPEGAETAWLDWSNRATVTAHNNITSHVC